MEENARPARTKNHIHLPGRGRNGVEVNLGLTQGFPRHGFPKTWVDIAVIGFAPARARIALFTATVFLGTFYPLFVEATSGAKISVGAPYFDIVFAPLMIALIGVMAIAPMVRWRKDTLSRHKTALMRAGLFVIAVLFLTLLIGRSVLGAISAGFAAWLIAGTLITLYKRSDGKWAKLRRQPAGTWGFALSHLGVAIFTLGVTAMSVGAKDTVGRVLPGDTLSVGSYTFTLNELSEGQRDNYLYQSASVTVSKDGTVIDELFPEQRLYPVRRMVTSEAGFRWSLGTMLFAGVGNGAVGEDLTDGMTMRVYSQPGVAWIWIGALLMAFAGFVSMADRRLRLPKPARETANPAPSPELVPAE
jgi:cytochrome c-type biogenesis protein CcmF